MQADFLTKGYMMRRKDWCRGCNKITDHVLRFRGMAEQAVFYRLGCCTCLEKHGQKVTTIKSLGFDAKKTKEAVEALPNPSRVESMALNSWTFLVTHPSYLEWGTQVPGLVG